MNGCIEFTSSNFSLRYVYIEHEKTGSKIKSSDTCDDEDVLKSVCKELEQDEYYNFKLESIISLDKPNITTVIVNTRYQKIALEIEKDSRKIISKERMV